MEGIFAECCRGFGRTKTYGDLRGDIWDNPPVLSHRRPDGAVVADPTPALVRQASIADDETTGVALHSAGEDVVPFGVVGTGVLHILLDDVGAIGAGGAEGVGRRSGLGHANRPGGNSEQSSCRQPNVTGLSRARQSWRTARLQSPHQRPPITWISSYRSATSTARADPQPQHVAELVGVRIVERRRRGVHCVRRALRSSCIAFNVGGLPRCGTSWRRRRSSCRCVC